MDSQFDQILKFEIDSSVILNYRHTKCLDKKSKTKNIKYNAQIVWCYYHNVLSQKSINHKIFDIKNVKKNRAIWFTLKALEKEKAPSRFRKESLFLQNVDFIAILKVKFRLSEKATKICAIFFMVWKFSEYLYDQTMS